MTSADFWIEFVLATLAVWRVSHLLVQEDGPMRLAAWVRVYFAGSGLAPVRFPPFPDTST